MKPLGQKPHKRNFVDHHIQGFKNWWEVEGCEENKAADKREAEKEIEQWCLGMTYLEPHFEDYEND